MKNLRVFGSLAYANVPDVKRSQFDSKARKLLFVSSCDTSESGELYNHLQSGCQIYRAKRWVVNSKRFGLKLQ